MDVVSASEILTTEEVDGYGNAYRMYKGEKYQFNDVETGDIDYYLVNQTTNGGWSGDEFAGELLIPFGEDEFVLAEYNC